MATQGTAKCKIFYFTNPDDAYIENEINEWLNRGPTVAIHNVLQSTSCIQRTNRLYNYVLITIFYSEIG